MTVRPSSPVRHASASAPSHRADILPGVEFELAVDSPAAGAARLRLSGHLDDAAALEVLHVAADVVACGCSRLVVDLDGVSSFDDGTAYAVRGCTRLARWLPEGVAVVTGPGAGERLAESAGVCAHPTGTVVSCPAC